MKALNLGCGRRKMPSKDDFECINLDMEPSMEPDIVADFTQQLPFEEDEFDEVYLFHTLEHIAKKLHPCVFFAIRRVLKTDGVLYLSYPEFSIICKNWLENHKGQREFWEKTIFGRQLYPSDFHVCAVDSVELTLLLEDSGFREIAYKAEALLPYNMILKAVACDPPITRERLVFDEVINTGGQR